MNQKTLLYNGMYVAEFIDDNKQHYYEITSSSTGQKTRPISVTTVLKIINKDALIQWSSNMAARFAVDNYQTIKNKEELYDVSRMYYKADSKEAMNTGTRVHDTIEAFVEAWKQDFTIEPTYATLLEILEDDKKAELNLDPKAQSALRKFKIFHDTFKIKYGQTEQIVYSKAYGFAGKPDGLITIPDHKRPFVWEIKTSADLYAEYLLQGSAYVAALYEETLVEHDLLLTKFGKDGKAAYCMVDFADCMDYFDGGFLPALELNDFFNRIEKEGIMNSSKRIVGQKEIK